MASQETEELAAGESEPDGEGNGATQNTEGLNTGSLKDRLQSGGIADGQISQEVVKPPNSGLTTKNLTPEQRQQIIKECVEDRINPSALARKWNCNAFAIRAWVRKAGLTLPKHYKRISPGPTSYFHSIYVSSEEEEPAVEDVDQIKQEPEDADSALSLPDNRAGKKRKRSPSPLSNGKESLREDQGGKKTTGEAGEVAEKANLFLETITVETFIDYNRSARKLLHSDDIPRDVVFKVFNSKEDGNTSSRYGECLLFFSITY